METINSLLHYIVIDVSFSPSIAITALTLRFSDSLMYCYFKENVCVCVCVCGVDLGIRTERPTR